MNKEKKRVAFYIDSLNKGGTEKATVDLINNLDRSKYEITLIMFFPEGEYRQNVRHDIQVKTRCHIIKLFRWSNRIQIKLKYWCRTFYEQLPGRIAHKILIGDKYDIEVACGYYLPTKIIENSKYAKKISWVHMDYTIDKSRIGDFSKEEGQQYFGKMDRIVCVSKECEGKFNLKFDMKDRTIARYNVLDVKKILQKADKKEFRMEESEGFVNVVTVGRLTWQKGYDRLLKIWNKLVINGMKCRLYILGEGEDREKLEAYIKEKDLEKFVQLLGYVKNPYPYIKNADIFVCSSRHESFSLVVAESLILGTPVVSTSCTGPNELLDYGKYGVVTKNKEDDLYEALYTMIIDKEYRRQMAEKAAERRQFFDMKYSTKRWEEVLDE